MGLKDIYRAFHPITTECTSSLPVHGTFLRKGKRLSHKQHLSKFKLIELIPCTFSDYRGIKLEINKNNKTLKNTWKSNNILVNNQCFIEEIKKGNQECS